MLTLVADPNAEIRLRVFGGMHPDRRTAGALLLGGGTVVAAASLLVGMGAFLKGVSDGACYSNCGNFNTDEKWARGGFIASGVGAVAVVAGIVLMLTSPPLEARRE